MRSGWSIPLFALLPVLSAPQAHAGPLDESGKTLGLRGQLYPESDQKRAERVLQTDGFRAEVPANAVRQLPRFYSPLHKWP